MCVWCEKLLTQVFVASAHPVLLHLFVKSFCLGCGVKAFSLVRCLSEALLSSFDEGFSVALLSGLLNGSVPLSYLSKLLADNSLGALVSAYFTLITLWNGSFTALDSQVLSFTGIASASVGTSAFARIATSSAIFSSVSTSEILWHSLLSNIYF